MIALFIVALVFDLFLLFTAPLVLLVLLTIGIPLAITAGLWMHAFPRRLIP